uniref:Integrator complex subunit 11 n=1 Tax=Hymenolepis diminuta TaxID=6216 RepID=A0A0R3SET5_HYMDI
LVSAEGRNIMLDCGMHMGYTDERRFPDFSFISNKNDLTEYLSCVIIRQVHFHLDHVGALPYMTEVVGYNGPIYMTHPTKAICPILLNDFRRLMDKRSEQSLFSAEMIDRCMKKVTCVYLHQSVQVDDTIEIQAYYAGHVLGAAMFHIKIGDKSIFYTGDYNMTADRHLGAAWCPRIRPDLLITETTYATTIRDSKRAREREFLEKIHSCLDNGGKVLIPVFALGRVQELSILLESYWERMNLSYPIYFSHGMAEKATNLYKLFISWTNQRIKEIFVERNPFDYKHIELLSQNVPDKPGPKVVFATPGMLHGGQSFAIFRKWAHDPKNMVVFPGFCISGTVGYKVLNGAEYIDCEEGRVPVNLRVEYLSFSAHADARGIMQLISYCRPGHVLLVHGESGKMDFLRKRIEEETGIPCSMPANGEIAFITPRPKFTVLAPAEMVKKFVDENSIARKGLNPDIFRGGIVINGDGSEAVLLNREDALQSVGLSDHAMLFTSVHAFTSMESIPVLVKRISLVCQELVQKGDIETDDSGLTISRDIAIDIEEDDAVNFVLRITYSLKDEELGAKLFSKLKDALPHDK